MSGLQIPKIPFSFFADFWVWVTSEAWGSVSVGFWGSCQLSLFWGEGGGQGALSPPPPSIASPVAPVLLLELVALTERACV